MVVYWHVNLAQTATVQEQCHRAAAVAINTQVVLLIALLSSVPLIFYPVYIEMKHTHTESLLVQQ